MEVIKPLLTGKDIHFYHYEQRKWIIDTHNGYGNIGPVDVERYPAVKKHLDKFYNKLVNRQDQGVTPYNLRSCAYYDLFNEKRIVWSDIATSPSFTIAHPGILLLNTSFMINGANIEYLLGVLNSCVTRFIFPLISSELGNGASRYIKIFVKNLPIPSIENSNRSVVLKIEDLVRSILNESSSNQKSQLISEISHQIDRYVCELYQVNYNSQEGVPSI